MVLRRCIDENKEKRKYGVYYLLMESEENRVLNARSFLVSLKYKSLFLGGTSSVFPVFVLFIPLVYKSAKELKLCHRFGKL